ncbi:GGDEF domain-containing protein [Solidesulfovibrio sp.]|uniref:GGDEF domain-containing protein n=1 Tax=Solidesulfovibrio sp. TaxID=2910990 RepID=UPI002626D512|nr:GGDEF domain-containing protein [Solidesulfovibrio sp.]
MTTLNSQLTKYSLFDQVTNLPNRYFVIDRIEQLIKSSKRVKTIFGVIFIDIDNFKVVNDTFGHAIADALLKEFGFIVSSSIRQTDTVGRIGGDEFLVILTDVTSEKDINIIMLKIKNALTQKLSARNGKELNITASMGTALFPRDGNTFEELLHHSDQNMYLEKKCSHTN